MHVVYQFICTYIQTPKPYQVVVKSLRPRYTCKLKQRLLVCPFSVLRFKFLMGKISFFCPQNGGRLPELQMGDAWGCGLDRETAQPDFFKITVEYRLCQAVYSTVSPLQLPLASVPSPCLTRQARGRILGRNWDKSRQSFPPCYSQSPLLRILLLPPPPPPEQKWLETGL